jgi:hypothetical protein
MHTVVTFIPKDPLLFVLYTSAPILCHHFTAGEYDIEQEQRK